MYRLSLLLLSLLLFTGCPSADDDRPGPVDFDRQALLTEYADQYRNNYADLLTAADALVAFTDPLENVPNEEQRERLATVFDALYGKWQEVAPLITVPGEEVFLQQRFNIYPTDTAGILELARAGGDLSLPSNFAKQGLPAVEYLLRGRNGDLLLDADNRAYTRRLAREMLDLVVAVNNAWQGDFYTEFIENDGNSVTASLDRMVNDLIFNYERYLRAGKVGIPAGVFSNGPLPDRVEAVYSDDLNRRLLERSLTATRTAVLGGPDARFSLRNYLNALDMRRDGVLLSEQIASAFDRVDVAVAQLDGDLEAQVRTDNARMLGTYDEMQRLLVLLKVDMLQALNINVDYVDADGD